MTEAPPSRQRIAPCDLHADTATSVAPDRTSVDTLRLLAADTVQAAEAWRLALERTEGPTTLVLSRPSLPQRSVEDGPVEIEIVATGSEVQLAEQVAEARRAEGRDVRVVRVLDRLREHLRGR